MTAATASESRPTDEPVDVLVNLAQEGEIDPWDIDIVRVTDKFLERLDDGDLARSGRALLYASILLRMKSDYLVEEDGEDEEEEEIMEWMAGPEPVEHGDGIAELEREFKRRLRRRKVRERSKPETLDELVRELRERERRSWWKEKREYDTSPAQEPVAVAPPTTEDAVSTAHKDDVEDHIERVWSQVEEAFDGREELLFRELSGSRVTTYISLLFLASRGNLVLEQDEFYGDLWIKKPG